MKTLILSTSDLTGGAAVAANRLMYALQHAGVEAKMLVRDKRTDNPSVVSVNTSSAKRKINFIRFVWERLILFLCNHFSRKELFKVSIANTGTDISNHPLIQGADIIHLHWINQGFLSLDDIQKLVKLGKPIVWTMHDMWPCTGICHHSWGCDRFMDECGNCKFLNSNCKTDLSYRTFKKKRFISESKMQIVAVSNWLKDLAEKSALTKNLKIQVIPNVIDISVFFPSSKTHARQELFLPLNKTIILMGAARLDDPIKGFEYLKEALAIVKKDRTDLLLVVFGGIKDSSIFLSNLPIPYVLMGSLSDASKIAQLYAAADVTVVPSYYETFGQTLIEAMACGCPAVSFDNSGQTDVIDHKVNGYLANYKDSEDLATGIQWVLENKKILNLSEACVKKVQENYTEQIVAEKYIALYKSLLK